MQEALPSVDPQLAGFAAITALSCGGALLLGQLLRLEKRQRRQERPEEPPTERQDEPLPSMHGLDLPNFAVAPAPRGNSFYVSLDPLRRTVPPAPSGGSLYEQGRAQPASARIVRERRTACANVHSPGIVLRNATSSNGQGLGIY